MKKTAAIIATAAALTATVVLWPSGPATVSVTASADCAFETSPDLTHWKKVDGQGRRTLVITNRGESQLFIRGVGVVHLAYDLPTNQTITAVRIYAGTNSGSYRTNYTATGVTATVYLLSTGPNYYVATVTDGTNDSAYSNEICVTGTPAVLTIQKP